ncbi:hypothetical protein VTK73DRAFT_10317 [Phialemonium thermophilum]|uniref:Uncharacterized protein n=1 Tax=Phialemonium thermophilum TaxID=223376 RepID=A0ABR3XH57_9PEZI
MKIAQASALFEAELRQHEAVGTLAELKFGTYRRMIASTSVNFDHNNSFLSLLKRLRDMRISRFLRKLKHTAQLGRLGNRLRNTGSSGRSDRLLTTAGSTNLDFVKLILT